LENILGKNDYIIKILKSIYVEFFIYFLNIESVNIADTSKEFAKII